MRNIDSETHDTNLAQHKVIRAYSNPGELQTKLAVVVNHSTAEIDNHQQRACKDFPTEEQRTGPTAKMRPNTKSTHD